MKVLLEVVHRILKTENFPPVILVLGSVLLVLAIIFCLVSVDMLSLPVQLGDLKVMPLFNDN